MVSKAALRSSSSLSEDGTEPVVREVFMMLVMSGMREGRRGDGIGYRWQVVNFTTKCRDGHQGVVQGRPARQRQGCRCTNASAGEGT